MRPNQLSKIVSRIQSHGLLKNSVSMQQSVITLAFNSKVKYAATSGIRIEHLSNDSSKVSMKNRMHVQNHIGGIHACGMALLAETATGIVFGMNVPDTHLPLLKSMNIKYVRRAEGNLKAQANLTSDQAKDIQTLDKGSVVVQVEVQDSNENKPIECEMEWAWTPKRK